MALPIDSKFCISMDVDRHDNTVYWHLSIGYEYREKVKETFQCFWNPAIKRWKIPFVPPWLAQEVVRDAVIKLINEVDNPPKKTAVASSAKTPVRSPYFATREKTITPPGFQSDHVNRASQTTHVRTKPPSHTSSSSVSSSSQKTPQSSYDTRFDPDDHFPYDDNDDGDLVIMNTPTRVIPPVCEVYAKFKGRDLQSLIPFKVKLYVDEESFPSGVTCVGITGTIAEVQTYYENRLSNAPDMIDYMDYMSEESAQCDRAVKVVIQFIL
jgi:hypothetical protein